VPCVLEPPAPLPESPLPDPAKLADGVYATPEDLDTPHHK